MRCCTMCPRRCGAQRDEAHNNGGFCGMPWTYQVARAALHFWEEPCISGSTGSGTVFFTGCVLKCVYCQNYKISTEHFGAPVTEMQLIQIFEDLIAQGAANINLVNPTHYALQLAHTLEKWKSPVPVIYNSGGYEQLETLRKLEGLIDVYLPDLKYSREEKARRYSNAPGYFDTAKAAILEMARQTGQNQFDKQGMIQKGLIVRHLILPENTNSSIELLEWLGQHLPKGNQLSLMAQYVPLGAASKYPELNRKITAREYEKVANALPAFGIENGYLQELDSAKNCFVPDFDLTGMKPH